jgi:formylglycine-generating enzyme required for sulfatase activity
MDGHWRLFLVSLFFWCMALSVPGHAVGSTGHALLIANSEYSNDTGDLENLPTASRDGDGMKRLLEQSGYDDIRLEKNLRIDAFKEIWEKFLARLNSNGVAVFYFSGHGVEIEGDNFLIPVDLKGSAAEARILTAGISLRSLFDGFQRRQKELAKDNITVNGIFIIDACRTGIVQPKDAKGTPFDKKPGAVPIAPPAGLFVMYAASAGQVAHSSLDSDRADEPNAKLSVFTRHLLRLLPSDILQTVARRVRWEVHSAVAAEKPTLPQTPAYFDNLQDDISITLNGETTPVGRPQELRLSKIPRDPGSVIWECEDCPQMVVVDRGSYLIGSPQSEVGHAASEESWTPQTTIDGRMEVTIAKPFAIGTSVITAAEYRAFLVADNTSCPQGHPVCKLSSEMPATNISWEDAQRYVAWLNSRLGLNAAPGSISGFYRLPTEAEWEYAARAGASGRFVFGDDDRKLCQYGNGADQDLHALLLRNGSCRDGVGRGTAQVRSYKPNAYGLYDVHGNVWQWVADCWDDRHGDDKANGGMHGLLDARCRRVARGGSWRSAPAALRLANRTSFAATHARSTLGFRLVRALPAAAPAM